MPANRHNSAATSESPELRLLLACARTDSDIAQHPELLAKIDWTRFVELAQGHHVMPLMHKALAKLPPALVSDQARDALRESSQYNTRRNLFLLGELVRLLALFQANKIPIVPFKGPVLALQAYRDPALRQCGDLDVLVPAAHVPAAKRLLLENEHDMFFPTSTPREARYLASMSEAQEARYIRGHSEYHLVRMRDRLNVDLHWRLNPREMAIAFDEEALWGRLTTFPLAGREVPVLAPGDLLLLLCFNGGKDCWKRLDRICDVAELLRSHPDADWSDALQRARRIGAWRMVLLGLALAGELLAAPLTPVLIAAIDRDKTVRSMSPRIRSDLSTPMEPVELQGQLAPARFHLQLRERWRDRAKCGAAMFSPTVGDWVAIPLPPALSFLHYVLRPIRLGARMVGAKLGMR